MEQDVKTQIKRMDAKLTAILNRPKKQTWVKVGIVQDLTGWNKRALEKARENNLVQFKKEGTSMLYLLESIPELFIINKALDCDQPPPETNQTASEEKKLMRAEIAKIFRDKYNIH